MRTKVLFNLFLMMGLILTLVSCSNHLFNENNANLNNNGHHGNNNNGHHGGGNNNNTLCSPDIAGVVDETFGEAGGDTCTGGIVATEIGNSANAVAIAIDGNGKIVVAGSTNGSSQDIVVVRYNTNGDVDTTFGSSGIARLDFSSSEDNATAITIQSDGKIIIAGYGLALGGPSYDFSIYRLTANGALDTSFNGGLGYVRTDLGGNSYDVPTSIFIDGSGNYVIVGYSQANPWAEGNFAVARYNANGSLDLSFNTTGYVKTDFGGDEYANAGAIDGNGKIIAAGRKWGSTLIARYNSDGSLDNDPTTGFGDGHSGYTISAGGDGAITALAIDGINRLVGAGYRNSGDGYKPTLFRYSANGIIDTDFNGTGISTVDVTGGGHAYAIKVDGTGRYVIAGYSGPDVTRDIMVARVNADGSVDNSFAGTGFTSTNLGGSDEASAIAIDGNGKIVVAGRMGNGTTFNVVRYNSDGTTDNTGFGTPVCASSGGLASDIAGNDKAYSIATDANGKYVVAGTAHNSANNTDLALVRYSIDGTIDTAFGTNGKALLDVGGNDQANAVIVDGTKYVVAGISHSSGGTTQDFTLLRYDANGVLDPSFGTNGIVQTDIAGTSDFAKAIAIDKSGKYIVAGTIHNGAAKNYALARYNSNGSLDTTFNGTGKVNTGFGGKEQLSALAVDANGKYVIAGSNHGEGERMDFMVVRYLTTGALDTSFGTNGVVKTDFGFDASENYATSLAIQSDGKIVVAGYVMNLSGNWDFAVVRYNANGSLDTSFSSDGIASFDLGGKNYATAVAITNQGIVVSGYDETYLFEAIRLTSAGALDSSFGSGGVLRIDVPGTGEHATAMAAGLCENKIVMAGYSTESAKTDFALVRIK